MFLKDNKEAGKNLPLIEMKAGYLVEGLNGMGYDLYNIGTLDLALGQEMAGDLISRSDFSWVSSNLKPSGGKPLGERRVVRDYGGFKVGFFGLLSPDAPLDQMGQEGEFTILDPVETAREMVGALEKEGCGLVVLLSSLGINADIGVASAVPGIDVIFGGYSRTMTRQPKTVKEALIVQAGSKGMNLGRLQLELREADAGRWQRMGGSAHKGGKAGRFYKWQIHPLSRDIVDDPEMVVLLDRYKKDLKEKDILEKLVRDPSSSGPDYVGANSCSRCHIEIFREWATTSHAQAYAVLEEKNQAFNPDCLPCHTTGYRKSTGYISNRRTPHLEGVQCESCHGPGSGHQGAGNITDSPGIGVCVVCHNPENSPEFDHRTYLENLGGHALDYGNGK